MMAVVFAVGCKPENDPNNGGGNQGGGDNDEVTVTVATFSPQDITETTALCGGEVSVSQGATVDELGVCWSTSPNPSVSGTHYSTTNWTAPFKCTLMGLEPQTVYHVRAYALRDSEYYYGEDKSFTTLEENGGGGGNVGGGNGAHNGHDYIDFGLPSRTMWATCNVGADTPDGYGDCFAWGETRPKTNYSWETYLHTEGDAASANWGGNWQVPTEAQWRELLSHTTSTWTTQNGINGRLLTANGNSIFLPAGGYYWLENLNRVGADGNYWSRSISGVGSDYAVYYKFYSANSEMSYNDLSLGYTVRPVCSVQ